MNNYRESRIFINRELSWLEFNRRVLALSREKGVPLGEQMNFAAIYGSNLDEFFMIRVGSLYDQTLLKSTYKENKTNMTPQQQISAIMPRVAALQKDCDKDVKKLFRHLQELGLEKVDFTVLDKVQENHWKKYFLRDLFPVLSPQIVDKRHPFPFLRDRDIYIGALLKEGKDEVRFGLIPVSNQFERLILVEDGDVTRFALVEELILHYTAIAFGKSTIVDKCIFRVTRNADISLEEGMFDHDIDYRSMMSELLKRRRKLAAVRLQFHEEAPEGIASLLCEKLMLPEEQTGIQNAPLELSFLGTLRGFLKNQNNPDLFYPAARPLLPPPEYDLYNEVQDRDLLICYPYQSIRPFIQMLLEAAHDPDVISIKMTLYRVATESKVIAALIEAAESGKEVVTIVELRARFDEQNNIDWSKQLEQAGCTVIYGFADYKIHSKLTLITKKRGSQFEYISQIGTGNYNERTSELYTDLAYLTSKPEIGEEVAAVFNNLALGRLTEHVNHLIVAPLRFKSVLSDEIREEIRHQEAGGQARVVIKCNSISDKTIIETLSEASTAGVPIEMIVRGICCLQAGLPGLTDDITVRSLVGRYLEHSRIFVFGVGERLRIYIASGDFLTRNTERRVEVGVRIEDAAIQKILTGILEMQTADNVNASLMQPDGSYRKIEREKEEASFDSQMEMYGYLRDVFQERAETSKRKPQQEQVPAETARPARGGFLGWLRRLFGRRES